MGNMMHITSCSNLIRLVLFLLRFGYLYLQIFNTQNTRSFQIPSKYRGFAAATYFAVIKSVCIYLVVLITSIDFSSSPSL